MTKYDWSNVPENVKWIATDGYIPIAWGYENKPWISGGEVEQFRMECDDHPISIVGVVTPFKGDWRESLEERPNDK